MTINDDLDLDPKTLRWAATVALSVPGGGKIVCEALRKQADRIEMARLYSSGSVAKGQAVRAGSDWPCHVVTFVCQAERVDQ